MDVGSFNSELWTIYNQKPSNWKGLDDTNISRRTGDFLEFELVPNTHELVNGVMFSTNRWGMHDRDYTLAKPPGVHRTALLGASHLLGYHIDAAQDFENLTEDRLNTNAAPDAPKQELLNFAVYYYSSLRQLILLDTDRIWQFHPDVVMIFVHENEKRWTVDHLTNAILAGVPMPYPFLQEIVDRAKVNRDMTRDEISRKLTPLSGQVVQWSYQQIVDRCRRANVKPVWVFLPLLPDDPILTSDPEAAHAEPVYERWAADAGFTTINLESAYNGHPRQEVAVASWDNHPNLIGHRLLADAFYRDSSRPSRIGLHSQITHALFRGNNHDPARSDRTHIARIHP